MKRKIVDRSRSELGQVLLIVALMFVGLVAFVGLAIDGGNFFVQRRQAQNAADAAALAGTRLVAHAIQTCDPIVLSEVDAEIHRTINDYAEQNGISDTGGETGDEVNDNVVGYYVDTDAVPFAHVGAGTLPDGAAGVRVEVEDRDETYFMLVIGIDEIPSRADATALTGAVNQLPPGAGLLPIGIPMVALDGIGVGDDWEVFDNKDAEFCPTEAGAECIADPDSPHNAQRGWLNLNHIFDNLYLDSTDTLNRTFEQSASADGCPSDPTKKRPGLAGYASGLCPYEYPIISGDVGLTNGDFIHGTSGAAEVGLKEIYENFEGQIVYAPVFDRAYTREEMVDTFDPQAESPEGWPNGGGFSSAGGGGGDAYYYHVVGFSAFEVGKKTGAHVLNGSFEGAIIQGGITPTAFVEVGSCTSVAFGVMLWD